MYRRIFIIITIVLITIFLSFSQMQQPRLERGRSMLLASYTDPNNDIAISVRLTRGLDSTFALEATFTPPSGYHLYSKDLPRSGANGQGRPTLLELPRNSQMRSTGELTENIGSDMVPYEPDGPLVYPDGPVILTLPVKLPPASGWVKDEVSLTYTACSEISCKDPTVGKLVPVNVPGAFAFSP